MKPTVWSPLVEIPFLAQLLERSPDGAKESGAASLVSPKSYSSETDENAQVPEKHNAKET